VALEVSAESPRQRQHALLRLTTRHVHLLLCVDNTFTSLRTRTPVLPRTCFRSSGIYLPAFGVRSEVNVFIDAQKQVHVTGGEPQKSVLALSG